MQAKLKNVLILVLVLLLSPSVYAQSNTKEKLWTINDLLNEQPRPFAIGHRGYGVNLGENEDQPIENTLAAVERAFEEGISIVEVDVVITADGKAVVMHDDYLSDYSCVNQYSYDELKARVQYVPKLSQILLKARKYARKSDHISGLVIIEVKSPAPMCDPADTSEEALVLSVIKAVQQSGMEEQVIVESFSPAINGLFAAYVPSLPRNLTLDALQLLTADQIEAITGLSVTLIDKQAGFGLQWAEIGPLYRLPGYTSLEQYISVAFASMAKFLTIDIRVIAQMEMAQPGSAAMLMAYLHDMGFVVTVYTASSELEWMFLSQQGIDGIFVDDIPMGVQMQQLSQ